jgi:dolichyl-phosphate beta-glucosyltransferase
MYSKKTKQPQISIIIPVYNEEVRVVNLYTLHKLLNKKKYIKEFIAVNDGSIDSTLAQLRTIQRKTGLCIESYKKNRGKGYAIKRGIEKAKGTHVIITDVDMSTDMRVVGDIIPLLASHKVIIGTRKNPGARLIERQPLLREIMGKAFTYISQIVTGINVSDFTCGFKCYETTLAKTIAKKQKIYRWAFDNEYLFVANKLGAKIIEVPVIWKNDPKTKVRFPQDIITSLFDIIRIRITDLLGGYTV